MDKRNIAEKEREKSVLGASDTPIGTRLGEKLSPRATGGLAPLHVTPRSMNGSADGDVANQLPPLQG